MGPGSDPFEETISGIRRHINRRLNQVFAQRLREQARSLSDEQSSWAPRVDIYEAQGNLVIEAELPGLRREDIEIEVGGDRLTIKGTREVADGREYMRAERAQGAFHRSFAIAAPIDPAAVTATYRDGVLAITLPKAQQLEGTQVRVKVE
jgi:HSP20 family protein